MISQKKMLAAAAVLATVVALPATATVATTTTTTTTKAVPPVYYSTDKATFDKVRKGYSDLAFSFSPGSTKLSDPYKWQGVTFASTGSLYGDQSSKVANGASYLYATSDLTVTYGAAVLGLTLESKTAQTISWIANDKTTGTLNLAALTPTFIGFDNFGYAYNSASGIGLKVLFDLSSCSDGIAVMGFQTAVPEAATWAMMMVGLGVVGGSLRRRRGTVATRVAFA